MRLQSSMLGELDFRLLYGEQQISQSPQSLTFVLLAGNLKQEFHLQSLAQSAAAPSSILQIVACSCKSQPPCSTNRCSCRSARLSCTTYCSCSGDEMCANEHTVSMDSMSATPDEEDDD